MGKELTLDFWEEIDNSQAVYVMNAFVSLLNEKFDLGLKGFKVDDEKEKRVLKRGRAIEKALDTLVKKESLTKQSCLTCKHGTLVDGPDGEDTIECSYPPEPEYKPRNHYCAWYEKGK